jgi:hypothetical protein
VKRYNYMNMLDVEIVRSCILEAISRNPRTQYLLLERATAEVANERGLPVIRNHEVHLAPQDMRRFRETVWSLVIEGVIAIGMNDHNDQWPWLSLSEYGEHVIALGRPTPYDPSGYMETLSRYNALSPIEERYLRQALVAFRHNIPDAAAVMLGAASENLIIGLGEKVETTDPAEAGNVRRVLDGPALPLLRWLQDYFEQRKVGLHRHLRENLNTTFFGVAALIRSARNDAGHPELDFVDREQVFVNLQLFVPYREWIVQTTAALPL